LAPLITIPNNALPTPFKFSLESGRRLQENERKERSIQAVEKIIPTRSQAFELLKEYNSNTSLIRHALAVESAMLHFAEILGEADAEKWGVIGLIHDLDYEKYPESHCKKVREILTERNWPDEYIHAVESHGWKLCTHVEPIEKMEKVLYTIDELTGLISAVSILRPSRSVLDLTTKSVRKKWKDKAFAAGVNRGVIEEGAKSLGMDLDVVIAETIRGMQKVADDIGLKGEISGDGPIP
jgi:putative nucleotidyltransferase with HDIG domain